MTRSNPCSTRTCPTETSDRPRATTRAATMPRTKSNLHTHPSNASSSANPQSMSEGPPLHTLTGGTRDLNHATSAISHQWTSTETRAPHSPCRACTHLFQLCARRGIFLPMDNKLYKHERKTTPSMIRQGGGLSTTIHLPRGGCWTTAPRSPRKINADSSAFHCSLFCVTSCHGVLSRPCVHTACNVSLYRLLVAPRNPRPRRHLDGSLCLQRNARTVSLYEASRLATACAIHCWIAGGKACCVACPSPPCR